MSEDAGMVYTTQQVADRLGIGAAMLRRYAQTLERVTGEEIPQTRRDGRQFGQQQVDTLVRAKGLIDANHGLGIEAALRMVLSQDSGEVAVAPILPSSSADYGELVRALQDAVAAPLVAELRELRREVQELRALPTPSPATESGAALQQEVTLPDSDGLLVRAARRLERWLGRH